MTVGGYGDQVSRFNSESQDVNAGLSFNFFGLA